jgi:hypothetical protein
MLKFSKSKHKEKKNIIKRYCRVCDGTIYGITSFCTTECELEWKENHKDYKGNQFCYYENCRSGLSPRLGAYYCSIFCYIEQNKIKKKKSDEEIIRINQILKEVEDSSNELKSRLINLKLFDEQSLLERFEYIDMMKGDIISIRVNYVIEEIKQLKIEGPIYNGPIGQASDLFGGSLSSYDSTSSFSSKG